MTMQKSIVKETRTYCKYMYSTFTQPTLASNGTMGGDSFAVSRTFGSNNNRWGEAWEVMRPNTGICGFYCDEWWSDMYFCFYFPKPTKITQFYFLVPYTGSSSGGAYNTKVWGGDWANDRRTLIFDRGTVGENSSCNVSPTVDVYYQYYTLYFSNGGHSYEDQVEIQDIYIAGTQRTVTTGTATDYDYYYSTYTAKTPLVEGKYYSMIQ